MSGWSTGGLEGAYFVTDLVDLPQDIATNLGDGPRDFVEEPVTSISTRWIASGRAAAPAELSRVSKRESCC